MIVLHDSIGIYHPTCSYSYFALIAFANMLLLDDYPVFLNNNILKYVTV